MRTYRRVDKVGQGTYSTVYRGKDLVTGGVVALKHIRLANMDDTSLEFMAREVDVLARLGEHPNIVNLLDVACGRDKSSMYLVSLFYFNSRVYGQLGG
jgi:serine/threonine protein kinase|tara:strand:- start:1243 stop:1536 length:294 start_codon:yes stop_codon:yes gene_type:complete